MKRFIRLTVFAAILSPATAPSQLALEAEVTSIIDDNIDNNALRLGDRITVGSLGAGFDFTVGPAGGQVYYLASLKYFSTITERTYQTHSMGATFSVPLDGEERTTINGGATFDSRSGRGAYTFYDSRQAGVYATLKRYIAGRMMGKAGYSLHSATFPELGTFDYTEHYGFLQATVSLATGSTLIVETDLGAKYYATGSGANGESPGGATQIILLARLGQALWDGTGLSLTGSYQFNLRKESRYLGMEYGPVSDDEIFDDHYGYEGPHAEATLTHLFSPSTVMKISGLIQDRRYTNRPAYDADWEATPDLRRDRRTVLTVSLERDIGDTGLSLGVEYDYIINHSNDAFYHYTNNTISLLLSLAP